MVYHMHLRELLQKIFEEVMRVKEEDGADVGVVVSGGWRRRKFLCFDVPALPLAL